MEMRMRLVRRMREVGELQPRFIDARATPE